MSAACRSLAGVSAGESPPGDQGAMGKKRLARPLALQNTWGRRVQNPCTARKAARPPEGSGLRNGGRDAGEPGFCGPGISVAAGRPDPRVLAQRRRPGTGRRHQVSGERHPSAAAGGGGLVGGETGGAGRAAGSGRSVALRPGGTGTVPLLCVVRTPGGYLPPEERVIEVGYAAAFRCRSRRRQGEWVGRRGR